MANRTPVQDPVIKSTALSEMFIQTFILGSVVAVSYWLFGFQVSLLVFLILAFAFHTMNMIAGATSTNVQIAEIRDWLKKEAGRLK